MRAPQKKAFTLVELVVTMGILIAISVVVLMDLSGRKTYTDITSTTTQITTLLRQAQSDAISGLVSPKGTTATWGVHFENATSVAPFYALFNGSSYTTSTAISTYRLPSSVSYITSDLPLGGKSDVLFSARTGNAPTTTTIGLYMPDQNAAFSSTIYVAPNGAVSY